MAQQLWNTNTLKPRSKVIWHSNIQLKDTFRRKGTISIRATWLTRLKSQSPQLIWWQQIVRPCVLHHKNWLLIPCVKAICMSNNFWPTIIRYSKSWHGMRIYANSLTQRPLNSQTRATESLKTCLLLRVKWKKTAWTLMLILLTTKSRSFRKNPLIKREKPIRATKNNRSSIRIELCNRSIQRGNPSRSILTESCNRNLRHNHNLKNISFSNSRRDSQRDKRSYQAPELYHLYSLIVSNQARGLSFQRALSHTWMRVK